MATWFRLVSVSFWILSGALALAQEDVPTITFYNNTGFMQFDLGGSDPAVLSEVTDYIVEQTGVRPQTIIAPAGTEQIQKLNLLLGSRDPLDLFIADWTEYQDTIIPLTELLEEHGQAILAALPEEQWGGCTNAAGEIMCIPRSIARNAYVTWVRQDWLDELGLERPTTIEELESVMAAFKNSHPDFFIATRPQDLVSATVGGWTEFGNSNWLDPEDGRIKPWILQPGVRDWVGAMNRWWEAGYWYRDTFTNFDAPEVFRTCNLGVWSGWYSRITLIVPQIESACDGLEYTRTPIEGPEGYLSTVLAAGSTGYVIPKRSENPEAVIKLLNWMYGDLEAQLTSQFGMKDKGWTWVDEENRVFERDLDHPYRGEYSMALNTYLQTLYTDLDPSRTRHNDYLAKELQDFSDAKMPVDADVSYDSREIAAQVPGLGDLQRLMDEQIVLFITGQRPLDQWDRFLNDLDRAGMEDWITALTTQYEAFTQ